MICGIDLGKNGAIAFYDPKTRKILDIKRMPLRDEGGVMLGRSAKRVIDGEKLAHYLRAAPPTITIMEAVASSPQMGVVSAFSFGAATGIVHGVLAGLGHTYRKISPAVWKASMGLSYRKEESITLASKLFPEWEKCFRRGPASADMAEACLLAKYGERFLAAEIMPVVEESWED